MFRKLEQIYLVGQVVFSVAVILFGAVCCLRCLFDGQHFCAACFAAMAYVSGYRLLLRGSLDELREFNSQQKQPQL